jgi:hypothetical protein
MAIKFHRCGVTFVKGGHPCWKVQKALDDAGIEYTLVKHPSNPLARGKRSDLIALSGQQMLPVLELDDGTVIRKQSKELVAMIGAGQFQGSAASAAGGEPAAG